MENKSTREMVSELMKSKSQKFTSWEREFLGYMDERNDFEPMQSAKVEQIYSEKIQANG